MMKYLLMIYTSEAEDAKRAADPAVAAAVMAEYMTYTEDLNKSGKMVAGEALQPIATATAAARPGGRGDPPRAAARRTAPRRTRGRWPSGADVAAPREA